MPSQNIKELSAHDKLFLFLLFAALVRVLTACFNPGFAAFDDYQSMLRLLVPAQQIPNWQFIVAESEIRSPLARLPLLAITKVCSLVGVHDPLHQVMILYSLLGLFSLFSIYFGHQIFIKLKREKEAVVYLFVSSFYFLLPFIETRVMFESLPVTLNLIFVYFLFLYQRENKFGYLLAAAPVLMLACIYRPQCGILAILYVALPYFKSKHGPTKRVQPTVSLRFRDSALSLLWGAALFIGLGFLEGYLRQGPFHASLRYYFSYNQRHAQDYGSKPFYFYALLLLALSFAPFFVAKFKRFSWLEKYEGLSLPVWAFVLFFLSHSLVSHKEERFLYPILGVFCVLLTPLIYQLVIEKRRIRLRLMAGLNFVLLLGMAIFPMQNNVVALVRDLAKRAPDKVYYRYQDSAELFPRAYAVPTLREPIPLGELRDDVKAQVLKCEALIIVREDLKSSLDLSSLRLWGTYPAGPLEKIAIKLNPQKNRRRNSIQVYCGDRCDGHG